MSIKNRLDRIAARIPRPHQDTDGTWQRHRWGA
jgi:hypothetical protein